MPFFKVDEYYKSRGLTAPGVINDDRCCPACGNALRGLREGQRCPECGRPIIPLRGQGLAEAQTAHLQRLARALLLGWFAWIGGMLIWFWVFYGLLGDFIGLLTALMLVLAVISLFRGLRAWTMIQSPRNRFENRLPVIMRTLVMLAAGLTIALVVSRTLWRGSVSGGSLMALATFVSLAWLGLQTLACLLLRQIAIAGHDDALGDRFWNVAWAIGFCASFWAPFFALTQVIQARSGLVPVCCMSGYLVAIGLLAAQLFFAHSLLRLRAMVGWSIKYRHQFDDKTARMMERVKEGREIGDREGTLLLRDGE